MEIEKFVNDQLKAQGWHVWYQLEDICKPQGLEVEELTQGMSKLSGLSASVVRNLTRNQKLPGAVFDLMKMAVTIKRNVKLEVYPIDDNDKRLIGSKVLKSFGKSQISQDIAAFLQGIRTKAEDEHTMKAQVSSLEQANHEQTFRGVMRALANLGYKLRVKLEPR
ncbi:MAG: hypothetical protein K2Y22_14185 [Candidatus Obscuribacterales bacterium]|nr:hypothetical protein [Candidatus Obscuribacterales bacterium]